MKAAHTTRNTIQRRQRRRSGAVFLEFIVAFPILFFAFLAVFEFSFAMIAVDTSTTAVVQGAREGAFQYDPAVPFDNNVALDLDPSGNDDIADQIALAMDEYLGVINVEIRQNGVNDTAGKPNAYIRIVRGGVSAERGNLDLAADCMRAGAAPAANEIVVTLCYPLVDAGNPTGVGNPVPDWLSIVGFSLATYRFETTSRALLE